jgi:hypothetical protein
MKSFEAKITLRLYDTEFINRLDMVYKGSGERYESKNHFLTELLKRGLSEKLKDDMAVSQPSANEESDGLIGQIKTMLEDMHIFNKVQVDNLMAHLKVSEKLSAAIYNILLSIAEDVPISTKQVEEGYYDDMPNRLVRELKLLIDVLTAKSGN